MKPLAVCPRVPKWTGENDLKTTDRKPKTPGTVLGASGVLRGAQR